MFLLVFGHGFGVLPTKRDHKVVKKVVIDRGFHRRTSKSVFSSIYDSLAGIDTLRPISPCFDEK